LRSNSVSASSTISCLLIPGFRGLIVTIALLLSLTTVYTQFRSHGERFLESAQLQRHQQILEHIAGNPARYRVLSEWVVEGVIQIFNRNGVSSPTKPFFFFRIGQNLIIFLLAAAWYRYLQLNNAQIILGLIFLAWSMSYAFRDSDLELSLYSSLIFYLAAALITVHRADWWIPPLTLLAAFNRETAIFIPFVYLACRSRWKAGRPILDGRSVFIFFLALGLYFGPFLGLRALYGWRELSHSWGHRAGFDMLIFNLTHTLTWAKLMWMVNILPILCLFSFRTWPEPLKRLGLLIIPIWIVAHLFYIWISEVRMILIPLALVFVPGALMIDKFLREEALTRRRKINWRIVYLVIIISLTFVSIYTQCWVLGERYLRETQLERHLEIMNNQASNPWQYRIFSEGVSSLFLRAGRLVGFPSSVIPFIFYRVLQNMAIFGLAIMFYRRLKLTRTETILGLVMISWGMSYAFYNSDLHFNTYSDIIFYLIAVLLILQHKDWWIPVVTFFAALNRETSALIPFVLLVCRIRFEDKKPKLKKADVFIIAISVFLFVAVFVGLRFLLGWRSYTAAWPVPGVGRFCSNLKNGLSWQNALLTVNVLPLCCAFTFKKWPIILKRIFIAIVPIWLATNFYIIYTEETRFLLIPLIIGFVPGTMILFKMGKNSRDKVDEKRVVHLQLKEGS
jgi:hypothetical protein